MQLRTASKKYEKKFSKYDDDYLTKHRVVILETKHQLKSIEGNYTKLNTNWNNYRDDAEKFGQRIK